MAKVRIYYDLKIALTLINMKIESDEWWILIADLGVGIDDLGLRIFEWWILIDELGFVI